MSQELHYTSVPRGLFPGTRGFCTAACTANIPGPLRERLEGMSGYQQVFPPHDASAALNPVAYSHHRLNLGGRLSSVLSRVCFSGLDYTARSNKYAHHVVIEPAERPAGGPAWLLSQPGFMETAWSGDPRFLPAARPIPQGDRAGGVAHAWRKRTGDAGWAGVLAESFLTDPRRIAFLLFEPGTDLLPLLVEAIALLPEASRWDVEFSTYSTQLPPGLTCTWRGVLAGSPQARQALQQPGALVIDLTRPLPLATATRLVLYARTGQSPNESEEPPHQNPDRVPPHSASSPGAEPGPSQEFLANTSTKGTGYDVLPSMPRRRQTSGIDAHQTPTREMRRGKGSLVIALVLLVVVSLGIGGFSLFTRRSTLLIEDVIRQNAEKKKEIDSKPVESKIAQQPEGQPAPAPDPGTSRVDPPTGSPVPQQTRPPEGKGTTKAPAKVVEPEPEIREPDQVAFVALPKADVSILGGAKKLDMEYAFPSSILELYPVGTAEPLVIKPLMKPDGFRYEHDPGSSLTSSQRICQFEARGEVLHFQWDDSAVLKPEIRRYFDVVEDSVVRIKTQSGISYLALRHPAELRITSHSLTETNHGPAILGLKQQTRKFVWCDAEWLRGSSWKLGLRRWRIDTHDASSQKDTIFLEGKVQEPVAETTIQIIPDRIKLTLTLVKESLMATLDFNSLEITQEEGESRDLTIDMKNLEQKEDKSKKELAKLEDLKKRLEELRPRIEKYNEIRRMKKADLSLVIAFKPTRDLTLDVARTGKYVNILHK